MTIDESSSPSLHSRKNRILGSHSKNISISFYQSSRKWSVIVAVQLLSSLSLFSADNRCGSNTCSLMLLPMASLAPIRMGQRNSRGKACTYWRRKDLRYATIPCSPAPGAHQQFHFTRGSLSTISTRASCNSWRDNGSSMMMVVPCVGLSQHPRVGNMFSASAAIVLRELGRP